MKPLTYCTISIIEGPGTGETISVEQAEFTIGREAGVDLQIDAPGISRQHARLIFQGSEATLEDLGSTNGTFVNGEKIEKSRRLRNGDQIRLGKSVALAYQSFRPGVSATMLESSSESEVLFRQPAMTIAERELPSIDATMIGEDPGLQRKSAAPQLAVAIAGGATQTYPLNQSRLSLGRADDNQIVVNSRIISRHHAYLEQTRSGYQVVVLPEASNPIFLEGNTIEGSHALKHGDILRIGSLDPGLMVTLTYLDPAQAGSSLANQVRFGEKPLIHIGRDVTNEVVLDSPNVSRFHAQIERVGQRYRLTDLRSANGTFVNEQRITGDVWLQPEDVVRIGRHRLVIGQDELGQFDETRGLKVDAVDLNKWVRKDLNILKNISVAFKPREFIVVVGQSGGGKSTLVDAIAGYRPATQGVVLVNGTNIYSNFDAVHDDIGYVPQRDIIHYELTVYQALAYAAKLRMPRDATKEDRHQRIMEVLKDLDMLERKDTPISRLSGGQIKRVSIGVELLTKPGLFFLDEPTSGLDPGTETAFMHLMRRLADQGRTIIMITHATKNVMLADKVVFLARGGYLVWFGPPDEALQYFDQYRSERERRAKEMEFDQIYAILDDKSKGSAKDWADHFEAHPAHQKYVAEPLKAARTLVTQPAKAEKKSPTRPKSRSSSLHQFLVLSARNLKILTRDRTSLILMLLAPVLIGALELVLAPLMGRNLFDFMEGEAATGSTTLFLLAINTLLVGGFSQMREFVKESDVYKRERLVNIKIFPYVASKVWVALILAFYQGAAFCIIHFIAYDVPGGGEMIGLYYITLVLAVMAGMMSGLLASAISKSASAAPLLMILLIVPQIVLSGALAPLPENVSAVASTRWSFETFMGLTGMGADVAADPCWELDEALRDEMTLEQKENFGCRCMGAAVFDQNSCNFPGIGKLYAPEVDQPAPVEPSGLREKPAEPVIPPAPQEPPKDADQVEMTKYLNAIKDYQDEVTRIQNSYQSEMALYEQDAELYQAQVEDYQKELMTYEAARNTAVNSAEGLIGSIKDELGWTFVNKNDPQIFWPWLFKTWIAQVIIIAVYFILILGIFKLKDLSA
jgi:ABC-type multidrug transport system ATPase subunit